MNPKPKILGLIPARGGSKGIPGKNMKLLDGKPLISYTIASAQNATMLDNIIVSSDCEKIIGLANSYSGIESPFKRPAEFALDHSPTIDVVRHALGHFSSHGITFDYVVLLQPTSPFRSINLIDRAIVHLLETKSDSLVTVQKIPDRFNPHWALHSPDKTSVRFLNASDNLITRRQDLPDTFYRDGKIYISHVNLIESGLMLGGKIAALMTENEPDINLDTPYDWQLAEKEVRKRIRKS